MRGDRQGRGAYTPAMNPEHDPKPETREPETEELTDEGYFDPEGPGAHDHHLLDSDEGENDYVNCPQCRERILAFAECCPACGHWFEAGEAWAAAEDAGFPRWFVAVVILVIVGLVGWLAF